MRVILAHPGQQHSFKVATALKHNGILYKYITSVYDKSNSISMRIVHMIASGNDIQRLNNRRCPALDDTEVITKYTLLSLFVILLSRSSFTKKISYWLDRKIADLFGIYVARYAIEHKVDAVVCFSMNEVKCFEYLKARAPHIKRIVDCANAPMCFMKYIYDNDIQKTGIEELKNEAPSFWNEKVLEKQMIGIASTHYFLAPSDFVKKGLIFCGVCPESVSVLHYGSNFDPVEMPIFDVPTTIKFVYVGQVTFRKGMHYLLSAFSKLNRDDISLDVVGGWKPNSVLYKKYKDHPKIHFWGNVPHEKVKEILMQSNVFLFSSLTEGFSLSCLEALSCALPVVCSNNSGASDIIINGVNGYTFNFDDEERLAEIINLIADNKSSLHFLSKNALKTARNNTWSLYEERLYGVLNKLLN